MMKHYEVNWSGKERPFITKADAIEFMESLDDGSDLWLATEQVELTGTLLRSRVKQADGTFKVEIHNE